MAGYEQQIGPGNSTPLPQADPDAFGAGVAGALAGFGAQLSDEQRRMRQLKLDQQQDQQSVGWANDFANAQAGLSQSIADLRANANPGAAGHVQAVAKAYDDATSSLLDGITSAPVRRQAEMQLAQTKAGLIDREIGWAAGRSAAHLKTTALNAVDTMSNNAASSASPTDWQAIETQAHGMIGNLTGIDGDTKEALNREASQKIYAGGIRGLINSGQPDKAIAVLDHGALNDVFTPEQVEALHREADVAQRRQVSEAKAQLSQANELERKTIAADTATLKLGRGSPDDWYKLAQRNLAIGDQAQAVDAKAQGDEIASAEGYRGATPVQRQARIDELAAKPERSAEEGAELKGLQGQQDYVTKLPAFQRAAYATGSALAPIDWQDPDSIKARALAVSAAQQHYGGKGDFGSDLEMQPIKELIASPQRADRVAAATAILTAGQYAGSILDQVAPNDRPFRSAIALAALPDGAALMDKALKAPEAERAAPQIFTPQKLSNGKEGPKFNDLFAGAVGSAIEWLNPTARAAVYDNARSLYAATGADQGWSYLHGDEVPRQLNIALGQTSGPNGSLGGIGQWNGLPTVLPRGMAQAEFDRRISRSTVDDWKNAGVNGAPWVPSQKRTMTPRELRGLVPTMVSDGVYRMRQGDNTWIATKDGRPFEFDVRKLHGTAPMVAPGDNRPATPFYINRPGYQPVAGG